MARSDASAGEIRRHARYDDIPQRAREHCKNLLLDALACAVAGRLGEETGQVAAFAAALAQGRESSVIGGEPLSLAGATLLNAYLVTAVTMCDVHRPTLTHITPEVVPPALAIAERDGLTGRDLLTAIAAGCEVTTRIGLRPRLSEIPRPRLARARHPRSVRRGGGGRLAAQLRCRHHGAGVRARRQPGRRHVRRLGHADGEIPPVPRRAVGPDGGAAGAAAIRRHARISHRQGRRPLQCLCGRRQSPSWRRPISAALGAGADRDAAVAVGVADPGHGHGAVRHLSESTSIDPARVRKVRIGLSQPPSRCMAASAPTRRNSKRCCRRITPPR